MQRGHPTLILDVGIRTFFDEVSNHLILPIPSSMGRTETPICSVMEWFGTPAVTKADISPVPNERLSQFTFMRGSSDMQRRVTCIHIVMNRTKEICVGILTARSDAKWTGDETRLVVHPSPDPKMIA
jgi:hypothetical protein